MTIDQILSTEEQEAAVGGIGPCRLNPALNLLQHKHAAERIAKAQRDFTLKAVAADIYSIMKETPDLRSLGRNLADYLSELEQQIEGRQSKG